MPTSGRSSRSSPSPAPGPVRRRRGGGGAGAVGAGGRQRAGAVGSLPRVGRRALRRRCRPPAGERAARVRAGHSRASTASRCSCCGFAVTSPSRPNRRRSPAGSSASNARRPWRTGGPGRWPRAETPITDRHDATAGEAAEPRPRRTDRCARRRPRRARPLARGPRPHRPRRSELARYALGRGRQTPRRCSPAPSPTGAPPRRARSVPSPTGTSTRSPRSASSTSSPAPASAAAAAGRPRRRCRGHMWLAGAQGRRRGRRPRDRPVDGRRTQRHAEDLVEVRRVGCAASTRVAGRWPCRSPPTASRSTTRWPPEPSSTAISTGIPAPASALVGAVGVDVTPSAGRRAIDATTTTAGACALVGTVLAAEPWLERGPPSSPRRCAQRRRGCSPTARSLLIAPSRHAATPSPRCSRRRRVRRSRSPSSGRRGFVPITAFLDDRTIDIGPRADLSFVSAA